MFIYSLLTLQQTIVRCVLWSKNACNLWLCMLSLTVVVIVLFFPICPVRVWNRFWHAEVIPLTLSVHLSGISLLCRNLSLILIARRGSLIRGREFKLISLRPIKIVTILMQTYPVKKSSILHPWRGKQLELRIEKIVSFIWLLVIFTWGVFRMFILFFEKQLLITSILLSLCKAFGKLRIRTNEWRCSWLVNFLKQKILLTVFLIISQFFATFF